MNSLRELVALFFIFASLTLQAQTIEGVVIDKSSQLPLSDVIVIVENQTITSNNRGEFEIEVSSFPQSLHVQILGYHSVDIQVSKAGSVTIPLEINDLELGSVVVSSTHLTSTLNEATNGLSMVTPQMLRRNDNISLPTILNQVPGVFVQQGTLSTNRITIRGIGTRSPFGTSKIRAYYEDIPLTNGNGETTVEDLDLAAIGRIEILKGPNSSSYGAGLGGVINVLPKYPNANERSAQSSFQYGSFGTWRWQNRFELGQEQSTLSLIHSRIKSNGYRENNDYFRESLTALATHRWSDRTKLSFIGNFTHLDASIPSSIGYTLFKSNPKSAAANWATVSGYEQYSDQKLGVNLSHFYTDNFKISASIFYTHRVNEEPRPRPLHILDEQTNGGGYRIVSSLNQGKWDLTLGSEGYLDLYNWQIHENVFDSAQQTYVSGDLIKDDEARRGYVNAFAEGRVHITERFTISTGLNFNKTLYKLRDQFLSDGNQSGDYQFDPILSPRISFMYKSKPANFFMNVSHGFSTPTLEETLLPDGLLNKSIGPERGWNYEIGARGAWKALSYETGLYLLSIQDLLVTRRDTSDQFIGINAGKTRNIGLEQSISYTLMKGRVNQITLYSNASYQHFKFVEFQDGDQDYSGNQLTGAPKLLVNAGIAYQSLDGPFFNIQYRFSGKMPITDDNLIVNKSYGLLNGKIGITKNLKYWNLEGYVGVQNLTNTKYAGMVLVNGRSIGGAEPRFYYPGLPINFYSGVSVKYSL